MRVNPTLVLLLGLLLAGCEQTDIPSSKVKTTGTLTASGEIISLDKAVLSPPSVRGMWQLKIKHLSPENTQVKKGDVLVRFETDQLRNKLINRKSKLQAEQKQAEKQNLENDAKLEELKLNLAEAEMNFDKEQRKASITDAATKAVDKAKQQKQFAIAKLKLAQAQQKLAQFEGTITLNKEVAQSKIKRLKLKLEESQRDLQKLTLKAPKDGLVMYIADNGGDKLAVGDTVWLGRRLMSIPSLDKLAIKAEFDEPDTAKIAVGDKVKITLEAYPEVPYQGKVESLGQAYKTKSWNNPKIVFDAQISIDEIDSTLMRPGMSVKIELQQGES